jgi:CelD/BcsL family acetyltransferase involved in cellulose biosynthesis
MRTETFTAHVLPQLLPEWRDLESRAAQQPIAAAMLAGPLSLDGVFVAAAYDGARLLGVWPLRVLRRGAMRIAVRAGRELQPYDGMVLDATAPDAVAAALWHVVKRDCPADVLRLRAIPDRSPLHSVPFITEHATQSAETWWLETSALTDPGQVLQRLTRSRRKSTRRKRRALEAIGSVRFTPLQHPQQRAQAVSAALTLKRAWLAKQDLHSFAVGADWFGQGLQRAAQEPGLNETLQVFTLSIDDADVAFEIGFRDPSGYRSFLGAFSPDWADRGVGTELTACVLRWCVEEGIPRCDLLPPSSAFKAGWCDTTAPVWSAQIPLSRRGRLLSLSSDAARMLKPLYLDLSPQTRRRLNGLLRRLQ